MNRRLAALAVVMLLPVVAPAADPALSSPPVVAPPPTAPDLTGDWSGYWLSSANGHRGPLRATFTKITDDCYRVQFRGRFAVVIPFRYTATLTVVGRGDGTVVLAGSQVLGPVFGTFQYTAVATATMFDADFSAKNESGKFVLTRCGCPR